VRSTIRRPQPPSQRTVLGQVNDCFVQCEVVGSQIVLDGVQPRDTRRPGGLFQLSVHLPSITCEVGASVFCVFIRYSFSPSVLSLTILDAQDGQLIWCLCVSTVTYELDFLGARCSIYVSRLNIKVIAQI